MPLTLSTLKPCRRCGRKPDVAVRADDHRGREIGHKGRRHHIRIWCRGGCPGMVAHVDYEVFPGGPGEYERAESYQKLYAAWNALAKVLV